MDFLFADLPLSAVELATIYLGITAAYVIFGVAGFGTALVAGPILAHFVPLATIVPVLALLDFVAAVLNVARDARAADLPELRRIVPAMIVGSLLGAFILLRGKPQALQLALAVFVTVYALYSLSRFKTARRFPARSAWPFGAVGGVFSALFGSGGIIYAIYLSGRLQAADRIRVTQSTLIGLSTLTRAVLFFLAGVYADLSILALALALAPAMLVGTFVGRRLTLKLSREQFLRIINLIVLCSGVGLLWRYFMG